MQKQLIFLNIDIAYRKNKEVIKKMVTSYFDLLEENIRITEERIKKEEEERLKKEALIEERRRKKEEMDRKIKEKKDLNSLLLQEAKNMML